MEFTHTPARAVPLALAVALGSTALLSALPGAEAITTCSSTPYNPEDQGSIRHACVVFDGGVGYCYSTTAKPCEVPS